MSSSSSSTSAPTVSSPSPVQLHTFPTTLSLKLTDDNFLVWSQQVLAQVEGLNLLSFLESPLTPSRFLSGTTVNPAFLLHKQQDNLLVAWLLASMSPSMLTQMVGLRSAYLIWDKLNVYYASHTRAKIRKLKLLLKTPKRDRSISAYLLDIKKVVDSLSLPLVLLSRLKTTSMLSWMVFLKSMMLLLRPLPHVLIPTPLRILRLYFLLKKNGSRNTGLLRTLLPKLMLLTGI